MPAATEDGTGDAQDAFYDAVLHSRYCQPGERDADAVFRRVAVSIAAFESPAARQRWAAEFLAATRAGLYPAGRIMNAAGAAGEATMINCFVQPIGLGGPGKPAFEQALREAGETLRLGGGVGYDLSPLPPAAAGRDDAPTPLQALHRLDEACRTIASSGARRGAQMAVLRVDHPDIEAFIDAKRAAAGAPRPLSSFNLSVAVSDAFMQQLAEGGDIELVHDTLRQPQRVAARRLWARLLHASVAGDPGVLFIDRINRDNPLHNCERLAATNPCGEQPLPDYGACCLGSIDLSRLVVAPFSAQARFDWRRLHALAAIAVRLLDNVLGLTRWPLPQQAQQATAKRRIGLGFTGLGTALMMLGLRYGDAEAVSFAASVARHLRDSACCASIALARQRGSFPLFDAQAYLDSGFAQRLPARLRTAIARYGLRNSHLLSIAPTGSISLAFGRNVSSGIEPPYAWAYRRRSPALGCEAQLQDRGYRLYLAQGGDAQRLPPSFVNAQQLSPEAQLRMQAAVQPYIDAAISKTITLPPGSDADSCRRVYEQAWALGCKGCTTFVPSLAEAAILNADSPLPASCPRC